MLHHRPGSPLPSTASTAKTPKTPVAQKLPDLSG